MAWGQRRRGKQDPSLVVHFEPGRADLRAADKSELRRLIETYELGAEGRLFVVGYTDVKGSRTNNNKLSRQRAEAVRREILRASGIDAGIVTTLGKGADNPLAGNNTAEGMALNRRVEVYLVNGEVRKPNARSVPTIPTGRISRIWSVRQKRWSNRTGWIEPSKN